MIKLIAALYLLAVMTLSFASQHPLDGLSAENTHAQAILAGEGVLTEGTMFADVRLIEPKSFVLGWEKGDAIPRSAPAVIRQGVALSEVSIDLIAERIIANVEIEGEQSGVLFGE